MIRNAMLSHRLVLPRTRTLLLRNARRRYATEANATSRFARIEARLPRFLQRIVTPLRNAPVSHITAFLLLHEITAVIPLVGLTAAFHYYNWLPPYISEWKWVSQGIEKYGNYMRKKGWITEDKRTGRWWGRGEKGTRLIVELATSYAIVKALVPLRLLISVWLTPWFARWTILPITTRVWRMFGGKKSAQAASATATATARLSPGAGTNAVGAGVLPK